MNRKEKIKELIKTCLAILKEDEEHEYDDWGYYDDDYYPEEESPSILFEKPEIIPFEMSAPLLKLLHNDSSLVKILHDCTFYLFGYEDNAYAERVLALSKCSYNELGINGLQLDISFSGVVNRFELVSNDNMFVFCSGGVGGTSDYPMLISNNIVLKNSFLTIHKLMITI